MCSNMPPGLQAVNYADALVEELAIVLVDRCSQNKRKGRMTIEIIIM